ncbi:MAG: TetR/AcrR family transcriptional regulator [Bacilli bacterium]|nr:TetR/AcrR family transcriptional regulator [Bacilli bacterium]
MPRTKEQNSRLRCQRMDEILKSALSVYVEKGYAASEIADIAGRAGIAKGLVHYYFKDKATLFRELFATMMDKSNEHVQSIFTQQGSVLSLFERYVTSMFESVLQNREMVLFFMRMRHELKLVFSEQEIKQLGWPHAFLHVLTETLSKGMPSGEIRTMSPGLLAMQFSGALFNGMSHFIRCIENQDGHLKHIPESVAQEMQDAAASCMAILRPDALL